MALIKCPECSKEMSDGAASCPHCGKFQPWYKTPFGIIAFIALMFAVQWIARNKNTIFGN